MKNKKWYSPGLNEKKAEKLHKFYGTIESADYGIYGPGENHSGLLLNLQFKDRVICVETIIESKIKIYRLLDNLKVSKVRDLEGKMVEIYQDGPCIMDTFRGISVNKFLNKGKIK